MPVDTRNLLPYFAGPWEIEPNNSSTQANGPLEPGRTYYGYPDDQRDYFSVYLPSAGQISLSLANHTGQGVQLALYYQTMANLVARAWQPPYQASYQGQPGWYFIYIYCLGGYNTGTSYQLRADLTWDRLASQDQP
jgi:hypothetical protein